MLTMLTSKPDQIYVVLNSSDQLLTSQLIMQYPDQILEGLDILPHLPATLIDIFRQLSSEQLIELELKGYPLYSYLMQ